MKMIPHISLTHLSHQPSCSLQGYDLVVSHVGMILVLEAKSRDGLSEPDLVADGVLQRWIVLLHETNYLATVHRLHHFALMRLTEGLM